MTSEEKARRLRVKEAERLKALLEDLDVCNCLYPLVNMRNRVGHSMLCPAFERAFKRLEEDEFNRLQSARGL